MFGIDDAVASAAIAAGGNLAGQYFANDANSAAARDAMRFSGKQALMQRQWQEMMSSTAYQRARKDMEAAGLNPILAASQGGASTPSGASAQGTAGNPRQNIASGAVSSAKEAMIMKANLDLIHAQAESTRQQGNMYGQQANLNQVNMNNAVTQGEILANQLPGSALQAHIDQGDYGLALAYAKRLGIDFGAALQLVKIIPSLRKKGISYNEEFSPVTGEIHRASRSYTR